MTTVGEDSGTFLSKEQLPLQCSAPVPALGIEFLFSSRERTVPPIGPPTSSSSKFVFAGGLPINAPAQPIAAWHQQFHTQRILGSVASGMFTVDEIEAVLGLTLTSS